MERGRREDTGSRAEEEERTRRMEEKSDGKGAGRNTKLNPATPGHLTPASARPHWSSAAGSQHIPQQGVCQKKQEAKAKVKSKSRKQKQKAKARSRSKKQEQKQKQEQGKKAERVQNSTKHGTRAAAQRWA